MTPYKFETTQFGITDNGIHLLRSGFNYETIDFRSVDQIILDKGRQVKNWPLSLALGFTFFVGGIYMMWKVLYEYFYGNTIHVFYDTQFLVPVLPTIIGGILFYQVSVRGFVLKLLVNGKTKLYPIEELKQKAQIGELIHYFMANSSTQTKLSVNFQRP